MRGSQSKYLQTINNFHSLLLPCVALCVVAFFSMVLSGCAAYPVASNQASGGSAPQVGAGSPRANLEEGSDLLNKGAFESAVPKLTEASRWFEKSGSVDEQCQALIKLSQAYQALGEYSKALQNLERALAISKKSGDRARTASVLGSIGNVYIVLGPEQQAYQYLNDGLGIARQLGDSAVVAAILNNLGNLLSSQKRYDEAFAAYDESASLAKGVGNHLLAGVALTNRANVAVQQGRYADAKSSLDQALAELGQSGSSHDRTYALINIALGYQNLNPQLGGANARTLSLAENTYKEAVAAADALNDPRAVSYASGYLGRLYEDRKQYQDALQLTQRAIASAQRVNAPESLYRWQWQKGRILKALGQTDDAISAYRSASSTIESIRQEMSKCYGKAVKSFREPAGPLYLEFVDLLLQQAALPGDPKQVQPYLLEAREAVESLKVSELRDYFRDDCVDAARTVATKLDAVSKSAVVIYPIILQNRTELLVSLPSGMKRYTVPVGAQAMKQEVKAFRKKLEKLTTREFLPYAQELYTWLIRPLEKDLAAASVDTLVFVPDGPLRTIPMAALHDGKQFLISKYAIAITPGLNLTDPRPIERKNLNVLTLGLTEAVQGFPSLPYVSDEIEAIQGLYKNKLLLDKQFLLPVVEKSLKDEHFTIVHIASHGQFENDIDRTFLLSFDDKMTMDRLHQYVGLLRFREEPLELLTLSACQTAAGEDRAALGLAGIAVKAGARSALGTLWHINDQSSSVLVGEFYRQIREPSVARASALQHAQLKLLNDKRYQHPAYWSPFLLINNWL